MLRFTRSFYDLSFLLPFALLFIFGQDPWTGEHGIAGKPLKAMRERFQELLLREPIVVSLSLRWLGWLVALAIILGGAAPSQNLRTAPLVLLLTFLQLLTMSCYPALLRGRPLPVRVTEGNAALPVLDMSLALLAVYFTGGWNSPFYHFAITSVLAPSLRYGLKGAFGSALFMSVGYSVVVLLTPDGFEAAFFSDGIPRPEFLSTPLNPVMIGLFAAFLGEVLERLRQEKGKAEQLAVVQERERLAREIHDGVSQTLFFLTMSLENGRLMAEKEQAQRTADHLDTLTPIARKALLELRNAMHGGHAFSTRGLTFSQALEELARDYSSATGKDIQVEKTPDFSVGDELASGIYPIVQEALANACQHSGGDRIVIRLQQTSLSLQDNGRGFNPDEVKMGRGLKNLHRRAEDLGLTLDLSSTAQGTTLQVRWGGRGQNRRK